MRSKNWNPSADILSSITTYSQWKTQTVNPSYVEQKRKACQSKLIFFYCSSSIKNLSQKAPWPFQNPRENTVVIDSFTIDFFPKYIKKKQNKMYMNQIELGTQAKTNQQQ